jgi:hypothetical protein
MSEFSFKFTSKYSSAREKMWKLNLKAEDIHFHAHRMKFRVTKRLIVNIHMLLLLQRRPT